MLLAAHSKAPTGVEKNTAAQWNKRERTGCLRAFDWIVRPWHYFNTIPRAVAYLIAASGFYGGILFVIGSFAGCSPAVRPRYTPQLLMAKLLPSVFLLA